MTFPDWPADGDPTVTADIVKMMRDDVAGGTTHSFSIRARDDYGFVGLCDLSEVKTGRAGIGFMLAPAPERLEVRRAGPGMVAFGPPSGALIALSPGDSCDIEPPNPDT
jgi:hypothetical protein